MHTETGVIKPMEKWEKEFKKDPSLRRKIKPAPFATPRQLRRGKVGRNESCPCGSGKKFKKCCLTAKR